VINLYNIVKPDPEVNRNEDREMTTMGSCNWGCGMSTKYTVTNKTKTNYRVRGPSKFIISVAKGKTISLTESTTKTSQSEVTGEASQMNAKVMGTLKWGVSTTYSTTQTWVGPPESSSNNSRSYYWVGLYDYGTWKGKRETIQEGEVISTTYYSGSFREYMEYAEYSVDSTY
jgi:hypothetical protein